NMPVNPLSPYAVTKATGEFYCRVFHDIYGLKTASLRYFNVFGPKQDPNSQYAAVIPKFIDAIMNNEPPVIFGDGEQPLSDTDAHGFYSWIYAVRCLIWLIISF
ncbi:MAG: NAD-dependent epimerase/dehydratase family protein, partial [Candidatus Methanoperedens sp.]|nr:NAD-dependent epimerase/dehydratase family protein [Candidatus Methanoperedens sp.]